MKVKSESEVPQSCLTLSDSMDCSPPVSSVHGIFQARGLEWVPLPISECCSQSCNWHLESSSTLSLSFFFITLHPVDFLTPAGLIIDR